MAHWGAVGPKERKKQENLVDLRFRKAAIMVCCVWGCYGARICIVVACYTLFWVLVTVHHGT